MVCPSWYCVKIYPSRLCEVQQVEDDDAFTSYLMVYGYQDDTETRTQGENTN